VRNPRVEDRKDVRQDRSDLLDRQGLRAPQDPPDRRGHAGPPVRRGLLACLDAAADHPVVPWAAAVPTGRPDVEEW
jgi:hypothetical protein